MSDPERLRSLRCVVLAALDELRDLLDPDPAAAFARRAVHHTIACLEQDWLPSLNEAEPPIGSRAERGDDWLHAAEVAPRRQHGGISERG